MTISRNELANRAKAKLGVSKCQDIWAAILNEEVGCHEVGGGNRPCDCGTICDRCMQEVYGELYVDRLLEAVKSDAR